MSPNPKVRTFTGYEKFVVAVLTFLQFTIVLDFMILSPLGAILMPAMNITPAQFGAVVSAYAFASGAAGFLAAGFADRFDRKTLLLIFYAGFILGTLFCALAPNYQSLMLARMVTGFFAGVIGSVAGAITTDLFPFEVRGRVMGFMQTAFAASQVMGIPLGLFFSNLWGWHAPFFMIVIVSSIVGVVIFTRLKPVNEHLRLQDKGASPLKHLTATITRARYLRAFTVTALLTTGGFMVMPFTSAFAVNNLKITMEQLPWVYMVTGVSSMILGPLVGQIADRVGKFKVFTVGSLFGMVMVLWYTHMGASPLWLVILVSVCMFAGISSRMIPAQAVVSTVPTPADRGSFMSVNSSLQQVSGGIAAILAGSIVVQNGAGPIEHFDMLGYCVALAMLLTWIMMWVVSRENQRV